MLTNPVAILSILSLNIFLAYHLEKLPYLKHISAAMLVIVLGAIEANIGLIPSSTTPTPLYDGIFMYLSPLMICFLMLNIQLNSLRKAGIPMIFNFFLGALGTALGALLGMWAIQGKASLGEHFSTIGGMFTATYIGGSVNMNAVALTYNFAKEGTMYAAISAVDNIITAIWLVVTIFLPKIMKKWLPTRQQIHNSKTTGQETTSDEVTLTFYDLGILIALGCGVLYVSDLLYTSFPKIHRIIWISTISLVIAQLPMVQRLRGSRMLGMYCAYLFLSVIGAFCDIPALLKDIDVAITITIFVLILFAVHSLVLFGFGYFLKQDWDIMSIASQANIGGAPTALSVAKSLGRNDLELGGILIGLMGNAVGTYIGILVVEILRGWF